MIKIIRANKLYPNYVADSVLQIRIDELVELGITHIVFDVDETLLQKGGSELPHKYIEHVHQIREQGIEILIGSNSSRDLSVLASEIGAVVVKPSTFHFKPLRRFYGKVVREAGVSADKIAMVGDRVLNDIWAANEAGLTTILVKPYRRKPGLFLGVYLWLAQNRR